MDFPSSSSAHPWKHDVFLSFRGTDTRKTFTSHLYTALKHAGIQTFIDDEELPTGNEIKIELRKAIQESRMYIIVFSENYASSRWCLDELSEILECKRTMGKLVLPLFYDVEPTMVRRRTGSYAEAFQHFETRGVEMEKLEKWRAALTEAADLSGHVLRDEENGNESRFIQKIVMKVLPEVNSRCLILPENPVGLDYRVNYINKFLSSESNDVRTIGIFGMGGIGKTTLAKAVFNENLHDFEGCCFVENIRDTSKLPDGILRLQEKLLFQLLKKEVKVNHVDHGIGLIKGVCCSKKVLILLDDLDELIQVKSLAGQKCWFHLGSRVIISTRDLQLLKQAGVDEKYEVEELNESESFELFSWHAFRKNTPPEDYWLLSNNMVEYAAGLPLALEVIGSYLIEKTTIEWKSALEQLSQIPPNEIQEKLKISFDTLREDKVKEIFLDLACFFNGMDKSFVVKIWDACGFFPEDGINNLMNKSLLKIDEGNCLRMHDLIRDMGREIIRNESLKRPEKRSRLWLQEEVIDVLTNQKGTKAIEGISLNLSTLEPIHLDAKTFEAMRILRLLQMNNVHLSGCFAHLFKELRWLCWRFCPLECLPLNFHPEKLVMLDMQYSKAKILWEGVKRLKSLKFLDLSFSKLLEETPIFSGLQSLETLILRGCESLLTIHASIGVLVRLRFLDLDSCRSLKSIPNSICGLRSLEQLHLKGCSELEILPDGLGNMERLWRNHKCLKLRSFWSLRTLPDSICNMAFLDELDLSYCSSLKKLPDKLGNIECLKWLDAKRTSITLLPNSIGLLDKLETLDLADCEGLINLPDNICNLRSLKELVLDGCSNLERLPDQLGNMEGLLDLNLSDCKKLIDLPTSTSNLRSLQTLNIYGCSNLERLPEELGNMEGLETLTADGTMLKHLPNSIGLLSRLFQLSLRNCAKLETLPSSFCDLQSLTDLDLSFCSNLQQLPDQLGNVKSLRRLVAEGTAFKHLPDSIALLENLVDLSLDGSNITLDPPLSFFKRFGLSSKSSLNSLDLRNCSLRDGDIPDDIGICLSSLEMLNLSGNNFCRLPPSLSLLSNLGVLYLRDCESLASLPELPPNLKKLDASGCTSMENIPNVSNLKQLEDLDLTNCSRLVQVQGLENLYSSLSIFMDGCSNQVVSNLIESFIQSYKGRKYDIVLPRWEIPDWFNYQNMGPSISFDVPAITWRAILWVVYVVSDIHSTNHNSSYYNAIIMNRTKGFRLPHSFMARTFPGHAHSWVTCIGNMLFPRVDKIKIYIKDLKNGLKTERCGIHLLYETDRKDDLKRSYDDVDDYMPNEVEKPIKRLRS